MRSPDARFIISAPSFGTTDTMITERSEAYLERLGNTLPILTASTINSKRSLIVGDDVHATFNFLIDVTAAQRGFDSDVEIIGCTHRFAESRMEFEFLGHP